MCAVAQILILIRFFIVFILVGGSPAAVCPRHSPDMKRSMRFGSVIIQLCSDVSSFRPNTGRSPFEEEKADLLHKYNKISLPDAGKNSMNTRKAIVQFSMSLIGSVSRNLNVAHGGN